MSASTQLHIPRTAEFIVISSTVSTITAQKELYKDIKEMPMRILENVSNVENNVQMEMLVKSHIQTSSS